MRGYSIPQVDDILYSGSEFPNAANQAISNFLGLRIVDTDSRKRHRAFRVRDSKWRKWSFGSISRNVCGRTSTDGHNAICGSKRVGNEGELESTSRHGLGLLILARQTRRDVGLLFDKLATDMIHTCGDPPAGKSMVRRIKQNRPVFKTTRKKDALPPGSEIARKFADGRPIAELPNNPIPRCRICIARSWP